jgi:putative ABC transport system permease protein
MRQRGLRTGPHTVTPLREQEGELEMSRLAQDLRYALRQLRKSPGFTLVAVTILALGIGANTAIFTAVYAVLIRPLPLKDADRLVFIRKQNPQRGWINNPISPAEILEWRDQSGAFEDVAAFTGQSCVLSGSEAAKKIRAKRSLAICFLCWG